MGHTRRLEKLSLVLLLREKPNSYWAGNISDYYENWRRINSDKYILGNVSFDKDQPTKAPLNSLEQKQKQMYWGQRYITFWSRVILPTKIQPDDYT